LILDRAHEWLRPLDVARALSNPGALLALRVLGGKHELQFRNGFRIELDRGEWSLAKRLVQLAFYGAEFASAQSSGLPTWRIEKQSGRIITPDGLLFDLDHFDPFITAETFVYDIHFCGFELQGLQIVDAGAFQGETALYFARRGAEVFAFEPDPANYAVLEQNLRLNPALSHLIHPERVAIGPDGMVDFHGGLGGASGVFASGGPMLRVQSKSLDTILREKKLDHPYLLKADCKGTEFDLVQQGAIGRFQRLSIEYSADLRHRNAEELAKALRERGFGHLSVYKHHWGFFPLSEHGMIRAER